MVTFDYCTIPSDAIVFHYIFKTEKQTMCHTQIYQMWNGIIHS